MSLAILFKINRFIQRIENVLPQIFGRGFPPGMFHSYDLRICTNFSLVDVSYVNITSILYQIPNYCK